ncbi:MAG TPA: ABC transporter substrate-binding protein [Pseudolabrys sp.]|nr:ABC transporter substrate-binding protein [Pseudolabrys sp.]
MLKPLRLLLFALAAMLASFSMASAQQFHITHAGLRTLYLAPIFIGIDRGLFKARDLEVTYKEIDSGALSSAALLSGSAQITSDDLMGIAPLAKQGKHFMMVYNLLDRMTMDMIVRNDALQRAGYDPNTPAQQRGKILKGMTIGITRPAAPTDIFSRFIMLEAGLDAQKDATLVQVGGPAALRAAFQSGKIDAFMLSPPLPQTLEKQGLGTIIVHNTAGDLPSLKDISYITLFTTADYAKSNKPALHAYVQGVKEAVNWMHDHQDEALQLLGAKWFKDTAPDALKISFDRLLPAISRTGIFTKEGLEKVQRAYKSVGEDVDVNLTEGVLWTNEFVKN